MGFQFSECFLQRIGLKEKLFKEQTCTLNCRYIDYVRNANSVCSSSISFELTKLLGDLSTSVASSESEKSMEVDSDSPTQCDADTTEVLMEVNRHNLPADTNNNISKRQRKTHRGLTCTIFGS